MELNFTSEKVTERVTRIFAFNTELAYLVEGEDRALLIDTASGYGFLREYVDRLTDKPFTVLCTHGHVDHALGSADFDEVYLSPADEGVYARHSSMEFRTHDATLMWPDFPRLSPEQIRPALPFEKFKPLHDGDVFGLGGLDVECIACPGHTPGSMVMLLRQERLLLLGDACNYQVFLFDDFASSVAEYKRSLQRVLEVAGGRYDDTLMSHGDGVGVPDMVERVIAVCDDILEGRSDEAPFDFQGQPGLLAKAVKPDRSRCDGGAGNIAYDPNNIW